MEEDDGHGVVGEECGGGLGIEKGINGRELGRLNGV